MRAWVFFGGIILIFFTLVYGGLWAVEKGMTELMALDRLPAAMSVELPDQEGLLLTFAGQTWQISPRYLLGSLKKLWERLRPESGEEEPGAGRRTEECKR